MHYTKHIQQRQMQRGIKQEYLYAIDELGRSFGDKLILTRKNCEQVSKEISDFIRFIKKLQKTGGTLTLSEDGKTMIALQRHESESWVQLGRYPIAA